MRDSIEFGESLVNMVFRLIDSIENDDDHERDEPATTGHAQIRQHLEEFDSHHAEGDAAAFDGDSRELIDEAVCTQHTTSSASQYIYTDEQEFLQGDGDRSLNHVAQNHSGYH